MTVETILKQKRDVVFTTVSDMVISDIVGSFNCNEAGSLIVIDHAGLMVGLLTERDILTALGNLGASALALPVSEVMEKIQYRCRPQDTLVRARELMIRGKTRYLPVAKDGRLVGVISMTDMMAAKYHEEHDDNEWMREYICANYSISYDNNV